MTTEINFNPFPVLRTGRIILRQLKDIDFSDFSRLRSDKSVNEFLKRPDSLSEEAAGNYILKLNAGIENNDWIFWAISLPEKNELIGTICLWNLDEEYKLAEMGFELMPEYQGKGIMNEAVKLVLNYAFNSMKLKRIEGFTNEKNIRAFKLMEKAGFIRDLELEQEIKSNESDFGNMVAYKLEK